MAYIMYRGADKVSEVKNELAGSLTYYADPNDALEKHRFVEKIYCSQITDESKYGCDFLGKRCKIK